VGRCACVVNPFLRFLRKRHASRLKCACQGARAARFLRTIVELSLSAAHSPGPDDSESTLARTKEGPRSIRRRGLHRFGPTPFVDEAGDQFTRGLSADRSVQWCITPPKIGTYTSLHSALWSQLSQYSLLVLVSNLGNLELIVKLIQSCTGQY
jgi:hypothetical protein